MAREDERQFLRIADAMTFLGRRFARLNFPDPLAVPAPAVFCGNHRSFFDLVWALAYLSSQRASARFMAASEYFEIPVLGRLLTATGCIPVDRGRAGIQALKDGIAALERGEYVVIMPEGRLVPDQERIDGVGDAAGDGVGVLVARTGVPVIATGLIGSDRVWPSGHRFPLLRNLLKRPEVQQRFQVLRFDGEDRKAITERVMTTIRELVGELEPRDGGPAIA